MLGIIFIVLESQQYLRAMRTLSKLRVRRSFFCDQAQLNRPKKAKKLRGNLRLDQISL